MRLPVLLGALLLLLGACQPEPPATGGASARAPAPRPPAVPHQESMHRVPVGDREIPARLCRPEQAGSVRLVVINHGSPANARQRPSMQPDACTAEPVGWFLARGHAVLLPLRRGYGESGGTWSEAFGPCQDPDFARAGRETARDIRAAIAYATALPGIRGDGVIVVGQSAGGWGALALAAENPPGVAVVVNMAGGRGGWAQGAANTNCRPDRLVSGAAEYGRTARVPTLWVYTANDSFFAPTLAAEMHRAFTGAGGSARLETLGAWARDGHALFYGAGGSAVWGPLVEAAFAAPGS